MRKSTFLWKCKGQLTVTRPFVAQATSSRNRLKRHRTMAKKNPIVKNEKTKLDFKKYPEIPPPAG
jgi:hypothetical protein